MAKPATPPRSPRSPRASSSSLDEVERALSVLGGRHPEFVRTQRETQEAIKARADEQEAAASRRRRARWLRAVKIGAGVLVVSGIVAVSVRGVIDARALDAGLDARSSAFAASGFQTVSSSSLLSPHALGVDAAAGRCFVAVTSAPSGAVSVQHGATALRGEGTVGWCGCAAEHVEVRAPDGAKRSEGVRLVDVDARAIGGREGWAASNVAKPAVTFAGDEACAEDALVGWIAARRFPPLPVDAGWLDAGKGKTLVRAAFHAVAGAPAGRRFTVVDAAPGTCSLAVTTSPPANDLALEEMDGRVLVHGASLLWCDAAPHAVTVRGDGLAPVLVVAVSAARVGGLLGAREWASRAGAPPAATWEAAADLAADATLLLRASGTGEVTAAAPGDSPTPAARLLAVSLLAKSALVTEPGAGANVASCAPPVDGDGVQSVCVLARAGASPWRAARLDPVGLASAPLPFWMRVLDPVTDAEARRLELALVTLARRLHGLGFEPTTLEGVKELEPGRVAVLGLAGDDGIVALEVLPKSPWVIPYEAVGAAAWTVEDEPKALPITPGAKVILTSKTTPTGSADQRRTVVFRRHTAP